MNSIVEKAVAFEKDLEFSLTYADPTIKSLVDKISPDACYFISDFYIEKEFLLELIHFHGFDFVTDGLSSCDVKLNKKSGRIFEYFQETFMEGKAFTHIHIGDNLTADVTVPKQMGIETHHFLPEAEHKLRVEKERSFLSFPELSLGDYSLEIDSHAFGRHTAMLYYGYARHIAHVTNTLQLSTVAFMTREGEFFKKVYDLVNSSLPEKLQGAKSELIEVSRLSTFFASVNSFSIDEMMRVWNLYSTQKISALFKTLGVDKETVIRYLDNYEIQWDELVQYPWKDERVNRLFLDREFKELMESISANKRQLLKDYLCDRGIDGFKDFAISDIGWRGTIQDNLASIFPECNIHGIYLGLARFLNAQPTNSIKYGYIVNTNLDNSNSGLLDAVSPIEMICNSENGSTLSYYFDEASSKTLAERKIDERENRTFFNFTQGYQRGVLERVGEINSYSKSRFLDLYTLKAEALDAWKKIIKTPTKSFSTAFFDLNHNEEFGVGQHVDMSSSKIKFSLVFGAILSKEKRRLLYNEVVNVQWAEGYILRENISVLDRLVYSVLLKSALTYKKLRIKLLK